MIILLLCLLTFLPMYAEAQPDITSNLVMHLTFDDGSGLTAQDSTVNNHDGTLSAGVTWGPGKLGPSAAVFNGTITGIVTVPGELGGMSPTVLAFPSAEGFGRFATGGRGGSVCKVTTLADSGAGSLRTCLGQTGVRTILFTVNGSITLSSQITSIKDNVTVACQSAPGQGVLIKGSLKLWDTENVIMRHCRLRSPPPVDSTWAVGMSMVSPYVGVNNIILDHMSLGWYYDDMLGFTINSASQPLNATVQWSIFSESAVTPAGEAAGSRGAAGAGVYNDTGEMNVSWLYNLYSNVGKRTPHPGSGTRHQVVNQVLHNLSNSAIESIYILARFQPTIANIFGNWFRSTGAGTWGISILGCGWPGYTCLPSAESASNIYIKGNLDTVKRPNTATGSELSMVSLNNADLFTVQSTTPNSGFPTLPSQTTAELAFPMVMNNVGAHKPFRDPIDQRAIADATNDVRRSACPVTPGAICYNYPAYAAGTVPTDTDNDGMPDTWETANGLNPSVAGDGPALATNGYSNLENYLNTLAGDTIPGSSTPLTTVTLAAWVKMAGFPNPEGHVISIGENVHLTVLNTRIIGRYYNGTTWHTIVATRTLDTTNWHHLAYVVQVGSQEIYLDGVLVASGTFTDPIVYTGLGSNTILGGHGNGAGGFNFYGSIDDARVYGRALSLADIEALVGVTAPAEPTSTGNIMLLFKRR